MHYLYFNTLFIYLMNTQIVLRCTTINSKKNYISIVSLYESITKFLKGNWRDVFHWMRDHVWVSYMTSASLEQLPLWLDSHLGINTLHYQWAHVLFNIDGRNDKRCSTILNSSSTSRAFLPRSLHKTLTHKPKTNNLPCGTLYLEFQHMRTCRLVCFFNVL